MRYGLFTALSAVVLLIGCGGSSSAGAGGSSSTPSVATTAVSRSPLITAVGDSLTAGTTENGQAYAPNPSIAYPAHVAKLLGITQVVNLGIPGATIATSGPPLNLTVMSEIAQIPSQSTIVLLDAGTNDIWSAANAYGYVNPLSATVSDIVANFDKLYAGVRDAAPNATIVILTLRDYGRMPIPVRDHAALSTAVAAYDAALDTYRSRAKTIVVDLNADSRTLDITLFPDGIHPNGSFSLTMSGAELMAEDVVAALR